jgi:hypothetical protein
MIASVVVVVVVVVLTICVLKGRNDSDVLVPCTQIRETVDPARPQSTLEIPRVLSVSLSTAVLLKGKTYSVPDLETVA